MGTLRYGKDAVFTIEERPLVHLRLIHMTKMRRGESFTLQLPDPNRVGSRSIWLSPAISVEFLFAAASPMALNGQWIDAMMSEANGPSGLVLRPEPSTESPLRDPTRP
jgi:hypothetical protein